MSDHALPRPMVTVMARYGLIAGILSLMAVVSFYYMGKHPFWIFPMFDVRIIFIAIFLGFGLREVRDYHLSGILFFWQGVMGSLILIAVMSLIGYSGVLAFGGLEEGFLKDYIQQGLEQISRLSVEEQAQIGKPAVDELIRTLPDTTLWWMAKRYAVHTTVIGFFLTIIMAVVMRRPPKNS